MPSRRTPAVEVRRLTFDNSLQNCVDAYIGAKKASVRREETDRWTVLIDASAQLIEFELRSGAFIVRSIIPEIDPMEENTLSKKAMGFDIFMALVSIGAASPALPAIRL